MPVLQDFSKEYPNVKVEVNSYEPRSSQEALQSGKEDVIIAFGSLAFLGDLTEIIRKHNGGNQ